MAAHAKRALQLARQLFKLSLVDGRVAPEKVAGVLEYVEKNRVPNPVMVLKAYQRYIAAEIARSHAVVEHSGALPQDVLNSIAAAMTRRYGRKVTASAQSNPALLAGLRVRVGDDVFESSVSSQLAALGASV